MMETTGTMKTLSKALLGLALCAPASFAQNAIGSTTLSSSISSFATNVCLASATGVVLPSLTAGVLGSFLMVDSEVMRVNAQGTSSTCFNVNRGQFGTLMQGAATFHGNGAKVWILGQNLSTGDPSRPISTSAFLSQKPFQPLELAAATPVTAPGVSTTAVTDVLGKFYVSAVEVDFNMIATGACWLNGATVTTDKHIAYLWDATGTLLANTTLAGTADATFASIYQCVAFTAPIAIVGPAEYFLGIQANGTTDTFQTYTTGATQSTFPTTSFTGTFGTTANIATVPTTFTTAVGPYMSLYQ